MSAHIAKRAEKMIRDEQIAEVAPHMYQAASSKPGVSYVVTTDPEHCDCMGFTFRKDCSHLEAARRLDA